ncbi:MAG: outer membrane protein assembly factor BamD [Planctomycetaceae bacterium]|nr:outer membrane protein assembly factor BamD [Planctomycetales bacterium]MCB9925744.1 outer membrane protein assembly factor BamD [Planctomycetaceae bacterium]
MQRVTHTIPLLALTPLIFAGAGCSLIKPRDSALANYERTREQLAAGRPPVEAAQYTEDAPPDNPITVSDFAPEKIGKTVRKLTGNGPNPQDAKLLFAQAQRAYNEAAQQKLQNANIDVRKKFASAAQLFESAAKTWPESELEQDSLHMAAESYFFADHYWDAETNYEKLLKSYPNSKYIDAVQPRRFAIAQYWLELHRKDPMAFYELNFFDEATPTRDGFGHAMRVFDRIRLDDPTGKLADDATLALGNAYFAAGKFMKADEYYADLRKTFPSSEHQFQAHFLGLKAKLEAYQGPDYSADAINEAEKLVDQIRKQFPVEAQQEREYLSRETARIRYLKAERDWLMAKRFDRRAEYGAAKHYLTALVAEYPETPFGERSRQRLREIGGEPDIPEQPLSWLVAMFPEDDEVKTLMNASSSAPTLRR